MNLLKKSLLAVVCLIPFSCLAEDVQTLPCENIFEKLETGELNDNSLYDKCGFSNEELVWNKWAGYVSQKKMRRAIFEICKRFPNHEYNTLYCDKAIALQYPPALIYAGEKAIDQNDYQTGYDYLTRALETKELSIEEEGKLLEILGVYYLKNADKRAQTYLETAAQKDSALANTLMGINYYAKKNERLGNDEIAFDYFWKAVLIGCKKAEENIGLYQLEKQGKITYERALSDMKKNMYSCAETKEKPADIKRKDLYQCKCKSAIDTHKRFSDKSYIVRRTEAQMAVLEEKNGEITTVSEGSVLPSGATVQEVRKTAVILLYPSGEREILNLYKKDDCVDFCLKNNIQDNLKPDEMRIRIGGIKEKIKIKPYHITFTPNECQFLEHYADKFKKLDGPYVGKEECKIVYHPTEADPILTQITPIENEVLDSFEEFPKDKKKKEPSTLSDAEKRELKKAADNILKF